MQKDLAGLVGAKYVGLIQYVLCNPIFSKEIFRFFSLSPPVAMNLLKKEIEVKLESF